MGRVWFKTPLFITVVVTVCLLGIASSVPALSPFLTSFFGFWKIIWWAILLGLVIGGVLDTLVPSEYITYYLARPGFRSILFAALGGFLMSVCSHGILAIAIELYKKGASIAAVITFLLASPWANLSVTFMLIAFFGMRAFLFIFAALIIAVVTGLVYQVLEKNKLIEISPYKMALSESFEIRGDVKKRWEGFRFNLDNLQAQGNRFIKATWSLTHMVLWWVIIGTLMGSVIDAFVPHEFFQHYLSASLSGLLLTLLIATIIEVCSEGSAPIALSIYKQTGAFGNAFVFLMAGVITDFTEIGLIWTNIGKRAAIWLPVITLPQAVLFGVLFNLI